MSFQTKWGRRAVIACLCLLAAGGQAGATSREVPRGTAQIDLVQRLHEAEAELAGTAAGEAAGNAKQAEKGKVVAGVAQEGRKLARWEVDARDGGGTLLFSDSPEYVSKDGVLYADTVSGDARVLYYHLNNTSQRKKIAVLLENRQHIPATVTLTRGGDSAPDADYLEVGKATQIAYFRSRLHEVIYLEPGAKRLLQVSMDQRIVRPGQLVYGVYDFSANRPVKVSVIMYPEQVSPYDFIEGAKVLPKDEQRLRGTFAGMNRVITGRRAYDGARDGAVFVPLADNERDLYRTGVDATDGSRVVNYGNYGILYQIKLATQGSGRTQYLLSPLGGAYAGAMTARVGNGTPQLLLTPAGRTSFGDAYVPEAERAAWEAARREGHELLTGYVERAQLGDYANFLPVTFEFSPPGASNLPVNLILLPQNP